MDKKFLSTTEVALLLGISRQAVFKKIKSGQIKARKSGRHFAISRKDLAETLSGTIAKAMKKEMERAALRVVEKYSDIVKSLGEE
ncbi:hypothetical protein COY65_01120 [Candidatus Jorgensenbacteria bacterium CG_4_10_14_0_8_um_filter_39_13]|uniref:Helix-turn-helix domain-containing protein n=2 Tax=Candidatus Joergenseniibacteriota TaxID=1752739 RepID=A0A2M7RHR2_9BACT|nr:MAG: hypothetical protein COV54_02085 [Candidatus Jorgensenbacteria bacterium CG11_big_fil_rev_8_21_14_0_20_38_23]PIV13269.1 MAG: hypothetical protein COS46_01005 [Candidatus Jorgensenbacteria bacterium CG03_land_8_20_14_0_80_38_39]PIW97883.1 MAG: hypothetical protein COZ81_00215 [Candidatus Jorgensenbacteria bacterium CG_4_8_14_3_um_filter_38_10]PIY96254.1 MAG: hypothetical protein COY65_01120 [Candidatus Jorgensenbacteria bacterium CG_4_10_14_0_8_um_filter_39_13]